MQWTLTWICFKDGRNKKKPTFNILLAPFLIFWHTTGTVRTLMYKAFSAKWCAYTDMGLCPFWQVYNPHRQEKDRRKKTSQLMGHSLPGMYISVPKHSPFFSSYFNHSAFSADPTLASVLHSETNSVPLWTFSAFEGKVSWCWASGKVKYCLFLVAPAVSSKGESWSFCTLNQEVLSCNSTYLYSAISRVMENTLLHTNLHYYHCNGSSVFKEPKII